MSQSFDPDLITVASLYKPIRLPVTRSKPIKICENLFSCDALYPLIRMDINDFLEKQGFEPYVGFPGWTHLCPDPPVIGRDMPVGPRSWLFCDWLFPLLSATRSKKDFIRVSKSSSTGAPFFSKSIFIKEKIYNFLLNKDFGDILALKDVLPHCLASRTQTSDPYGKIRKGPLLKISDLRQTYCAISSEEMVMDPVDPALAPFHLQSPRGRTPRMVSLMVNFFLSQIVQEFDLMSIRKGNLCLAGDLNVMEDFLNESIQQGFKHLLAFDRVKSEFNHHQNTILKVGSWLNLPLREYILNWNWMVRGMRFENCYMGNPSGIAPVMLLNITETLSNLEFLGLVDASGVRDFVSMIILGDAALLLFKRKEDLESTRAKMERIDILSVADTPTLGQKTFSMNEDGRLLLMQSPRQCLMNFWAPESDAGSTDRPFYGFGFYQRWKDFRGNQSQREIFQDFETKLLNKYSLRIKMDSPKESEGYDIKTYYELLSKGRRKEAEAIEPYIFALYPVFDRNKFL